ncbi:MAG TPA: tRNA (guanosine(37)-N1)-methyltransferase TrmD [Terracidiphilus sp.]|nr:tRNA (guanosine(37)-N1)-methyltransferase TrmD [Terracidiphilus sp.]
MRFEIVTIFPGFFAGIFEHGVVRRAQSEGLVTIGIHDLRNFTHDRHRTVDDRPFGGGEGMVLKPEPLAEALESLGIRPKAQRMLRIIPPDQSALSADDSSRAQLDQNRGGLVTGHDFSPAAIAEEEKQGALAPECSAASKQTAVILLSAQGHPFTQSVARDLAELDRMVLLCGRYEGVDERINELYCDMELSIGDYVLSGGELAAAVVADAVSRLIPGVLGNEASGAFESFGIGDAEIAADIEGVPRSQHGSGGLLDYPHYTRPAEFCGLQAPQVLLNGDHQQIRRWRREQQLRKTLRNRPDLLKRAALSDEDRRFLEALGQSGPHAG